MTIPRHDLNVWLRNGFQEQINALFMERRSFVIAQIEQNIRVKQQFHPVPQIVPYVPARESPHPKDRLPPPANSGRRNVESAPAFPTLPLLNQGERQTLEFRQFPRIRKVVGQITNQVRIGAPITLKHFLRVALPFGIDARLTMAIVISHLLVIPVLQEMGTGESRLLGDAASDLFALFAVEVPVGQRHEQGRRGYCRAWLRTGYRGFPMVSSPAQPTSDGFNATSAVSPLPAPSPEHIAKRYCTNCGTPCRVSARFCPNCGKQLD